MKYDKFILTDNRDYIRHSSTRFYYLVDDASKIDFNFHVPHDMRKHNYAFVNECGSDSHYLLNAKSPQIGTSPKLIQTHRTIQNCYDVVFLSNGEPCANEHYERLEALRLPNRLIWVRDIKGRNKAYKEAARQSRTPYFFAVFAKIEINPEFDFTFGCELFDRRHYVFHSRNPINGLEYGHQGVILYNKEAVLDNPGDAIDFTMAQLYRSIPTVSGVAHYAFNPIGAWRTAFRECLKLCLFGDLSSLKRLEQWQTGIGEYAQWSIVGAKDAVEFHRQFKDSPAELLKTYDWPYLQTLFESLHGHSKSMLS